MGCPVLTDMQSKWTAMRNLILVLGDQLNHDSAAFDEFSTERDAIWMAEVDEEATHVWCHKLRLVAFFSAMRHFRNELLQRGRNVLYHELQGDRRIDSGTSFSEQLSQTIQQARPEKLIAVRPGDFRVLEMLETCAEEHHVELEWRADRHFYTAPEEFQAWASHRKRVVLEDFYRMLRKQHRILMDGDAPIGGEWNYDDQNRRAFPKTGPPSIKTPRSFQVDEITSEVIAMVEKRFSDHPGKIENFNVPVTHTQALAALRDFVEHRLPSFGRYQDAMWTDEPFHAHSRLSFVLNTHLLDPRKCVESAVEAYEQGKAKLNNVEGFVRQILGWREFVRGIYWLKMPEYQELNALECEERDVPNFFWNGETDMACIRDAMQQVIRYGYAHHIQRLMVLGLFAQLFGVHPRKFHEWHLAMYPDAIDWVSLPNTLGMSQYGDGGIVGTKPYCASGNYINKMSNYCHGCRYHYKESTGDDACPFTTLYYDFLDRHRERFKENRRMTFQIKNLERKSAEELSAIRAQAQQLQSRIIAGEPV